MFTKNIVSYTKNVLNNVLNNKSRHKKIFLVKQFLKVDNYDIFVLFSFTKVDIFYKFTSFSFSKVDTFHKYLLDSVILRLFWTNLGSVVNSLFSNVSLRLISPLS